MLRGPAVIVDIGCIEPAAIVIMALFIAAENRQTGTGITAGADKKDGNDLRVAGFVWNRIDKDFLTGILSLRQIHIAQKHIVPVQVGIVAITVVFCYRPVIIGDEYGIGGNKCTGPDDLAPDKRGPPGALLFCQCKGRTAGAYGRYGTGLPGERAARQ